MSSPSFTPPSPSFTPPSPSFTPPSPSFKPLSPSTSQRPQIAASSRPTSTTQAPNNMNAATTQQLDDLPDDPTQRSTGITARLMNSSWEPNIRRSELKAMMEAHYPKLLKYYEGRRTGKIEEKAWRNPVSAELAERLYDINYGKVERAFFAMDYTHGFTGRGVLRGTLERPGLIGPRNETVEEIAGPVSGLRHEQADRPRWRASDGKSDEGEEEEDVDADAEGMNELMQLAAKSVYVISRAPEDTGAASSSRPATTFPTEPQATLIPASAPAASTSSIPSRKRARDDTEEDALLKRRRIDDVLGISRKIGEAGAKNNKPLPQQKRKRTDDVFGIVRKDAEEDAKRRRMDDVLGIVRKDANASRIPQSVGAAMVPDTQQSRKRGRSPNDSSNDGTSTSTHKRLRLYQRPRNGGVEEEHVADGHADAATTDDPTIIYQPTSSGEAQEPASVNAVTKTEIHTQPTVEGEPFANDEATEREDAVADDEAAFAQTKWDTAHGISSSCANIRVPGKRIRDTTGQWTNLYLPTSGGLPDRPWTEGGKEDLRVYIQDYGVEDWSLLSRSMNRPAAELQDMYVEVIAARNKQAGRHERAGIPKKYPNLVPPPPPPKSAVRTASVELPRLRPRDKTGRVKRNMLGDLTYDAKATSFPKVTRDGGMVDSKGNALLGIMGDLPGVKRRQLKPKPEVPVRLPSAEQADDAEQEQILERERTHENGPSPEHTGKEEDSLNGSVKAPKPQKTSTKGPLGPRFAGVYKLTGSSRRGVPRNAAGLRQRS